MPVDPKYAGLPGIAWDQPDTFETVEGKKGNILVKCQIFTNLLL